MPIKIYKKVRKLRILELKKKTAFSCIVNCIFVFKIPKNYHVIIVMVSHLEWCLTWLESK